MKRLIINADDFGLTQGVNRSILEGHETGNITSATLMANSLRFQEAVDLAKAHPKLGVGCHLMLVDGTPLSPVDQVRSLLAEKDGNDFRVSFGAFGAAVLRGHINHGEIKREAVAQISRICKAGISPTHFDTHTYLADRHAIRPHQIEQTRPKGGRPPSPAYDVNPDLLVTQNP